MPDRNLKSQTCSPVDRSMHDTAAYPLFSPVVYVLNFWMTCPSTYSGFENGAPRSYHSTSYSAEDENVASWLPLLSASPLNMVLTFGSSGVAEGLTPSGYRPRASAP